jgi:hypothetical protein
LASAVITVLLLLSNLAFQGQTEVRQLPTTAMSAFDPKRTFNDKCRRIPRRPKLPFLP